LIRIGRRRGAKALVCGIAALIWNNSPFDAASGSRLFFPATNLKQPALGGQAVWIVQSQAVVTQGKFNIDDPCEKAPRRENTHE
jgi:hypothetical protein